MTQAVNATVHIAMILKTKGKKLMSHRFTYALAAASTFGLMCCITLITPTASSAAPASITSCPELGQTGYQVQYKDKYIGDPATRTYGDPNGTIGIEVGKSVTSGGSITGTTSVEAEAIFAKVSASVGATLSQETTTTTTQSYTWVVPPNQAKGWVEAGHHGYEISYTKYTVVAPCETVELKTGTITGTTSNIEFIHS